MSVFRFPSGATLAQVKKDAKRIARAEGAPLHRALDVASLRHGIRRYTGPWTDVPDEIRGRHEPFFRLPLPTAYGLVGVQLSAARRHAYFLGADIASKRPVILQVLRLALSLGLRRAVWCLGADGWDDDLQELWLALSSEFPGKLQHCAPTDVAGLRLGAGTVVIIEGVNPDAVHLVIPSRVAVIALLPEEHAPDDDRLAFTLCQWPGEPDRSLRFLLSEADGRVHCVDFERWQGWLDHAVKHCLRRGGCSMEDIDRRWGGQAPLSFSPVPRALVDDVHWCDYLEWAAAESVEARHDLRLSSASLTAQLRWLALRESSVGQRHELVK